MQGGAEGLLRVERVVAAMMANVAAVLDVLCQVSPNTSLTLSSVSSLCRNQSIPASAESCNLLTGVVSLCMRAAHNMFLECFALLLFSLQSLAQTNLQAA